MYLNFILDFIRPFSPFHSLVIWGILVYHAFIRLIDRVIEGEAPWLNSTQYRGLSLFPCYK